MELTGVLDAKDYYYALLTRLVTFPIHTVAAINGRKYPPIILLVRCFRTHQPSCRLLRWRIGIGPSLRLEGHAGGLFSQSTLRPILTTCLRASGLGAA